MTISPAHRFRRRAALVGALVMLCAARPQLQQPPAPAAAATTPPKLVVVLVVDQMRGDYLERYGALLTKGLRRLADQGAWFTEGAYPYLNTVTCVGHSTIGTGTYPYRHGMVLNAWLERSSGKVPGCTDDPSTKEVAYSNLKVRSGDSARKLQRPALGEQFRERGGHAVALSLKPRSSIPLVGRRADAVVWFDERGGWQTSSAFSRTPVPFVRDFVAANPVTADKGRNWTKTLEPTAYQGEDDVKEERPPAGSTRTFPHALDAPPQKGSSEDFFSRWQRSPFADEYLGRLAEAAVDALALGKGEHADYLAVSFSSLDMVGHAFGPRSHEVQDVLVRLDATIGRLLDHLDRQVGVGGYVLALSADHGVADIPELAGSGGRQSSAGIEEALAKVLVPTLGKDASVVVAAYTDIYLTPKALSRLRSDATLRAATTEALLALPSIARVFFGADLASAEARASTDPAVRAAALSHYPGRSGDLIIVPKEQWLLSTSGTTHGTLHPYDQRVPVLLFGASIRPGRYPGPASPADLAPTLASIAQVTIAATDGRILSEALTGGAGPTR